MDAPERTDAPLFADKWPNMKAAGWAECLARAIPPSTHRTLLAREAMARGMTMTELAGKLLATVEISQ